MDGTKEEPITLRGNRRGDPAIVKGEDDRAACIEINHDYYILEVSTALGERELQHTNYFIF